MAAVPSGPAGALRQAMLRVVLPPLAIAAALLSAGTLLLLAATIDLVPLPAAGGPALPPATAPSPPAFSDATPLRLDVAVRNRTGAPDVPPGPWRREPDAPRSVAPGR